MSVDERPTGSDATVSQLVAQLSQQTSRLVRDEMRLAQAELKDKGKHAGLGVGMFSAAGLLVFFGLGALFFAAGLALALVLPGWASALIVAGVLFVAAIIAALLGKKEVQQAAPKPEKTLDSVHQDLETVKEARQG